MKKILFVEDQPEFKLNKLFGFFKLNNINVQYEVVGSVNEAKRYLRNNKNNIDLVVTDLGLPIFKGEMVKNSLQGMDIVLDMWSFNTKVPVIIYSTTIVPNLECTKEAYEKRGQQLYKVANIMDMKEWLIEFLQN